MEGKPGILIILVIVDILLILAAAAFGVFFAIKQTLVFEENMLNLYAAIGCGVMFIFTSLGIIIARNARISADNTYDILRHLELLVKKEGISLSDLARRAQKDAIRTEKKVRKAKNKRNEEIAIQEASEDESLGIGTDSLGNQNALGDLPTIETSTQTQDIPSAPAADLALGNSAPEPAVSANEKSEPNCGYDYATWKQNLEGKIICGEDQQPMVVRNTKQGKFIIICQDALNKNGTCTQKKALPVEQFAIQFINWYDQFYNERLLVFSFDDFERVIQNVTIFNLECKFVANT